MRYTGHVGQTVAFLSVMLVLSQLGCPPTRVAVPNLVGMTQADAESALADAGLVVGDVEEEYSATVPVGQVISQSPVAGVRVAPGAPVALVISLGPSGEGEGEGEGEAPTVTLFAINNGAASTVSRSVSLANTCTGLPTEYMASEAENFSGASWHPYLTNPSFALSAGNSTKTVYFKTRSARGESNVLSDTIVLNEPSGDGIVTLDVKENANVGVAEYPVSVVIPLPYGQYTNAGTLGIADTPSQVEVMNRWPDASLRHVLVHFQASAGALGDAGYVFTNAAPPAPVTPVTVAGSAPLISVTTGPLRFTINANRFNIFDDVWRDANGDGVFSDDEHIIVPDTQNGGVFTPRSGAGAAQYDTARAGLRVDIEERGPMRAVIRVEAPARFESTTQHTHGFAVRIYAYAGKSYVKVDYQLQNSAKNAVRSWPLYFESMNLDFRLNLEGSHTVRFGRGDGTAYHLADGANGYLAQERHDHFQIHALPSGASLYDSGVMATATGPEGFIDVSNGQHGVTAVVRNFWQMWPNGLAIDEDNRLSLQLFPDWSAQWLDRLNDESGTALRPGHVTETGLYWVDDMQHVYKEALLYFHGPSIPDAELIALAKTFQFHPTAIVPTDWYRTTKATLDLGGIIPPASVIPSVEERRTPIYRTEGFDFGDWYNPDSPFYGAGWVNFYDPEPGYRADPSVPGGWPYSAAHVIATTNSGDYFEGEAHGQSELNLRPEWMAQYQHDADWALLQLTENPYGGGRWRIFDGNGISKLAAEPLPNTVNEMPAYGARDDQHGWFYHVAENYLLTGNPWIRDWYGFIAEFRRTRLERLEPFPDTVSRATGHSLNQVLQAYRVTGDTELLARFAAHVRTYLRPEQDPQYGDQREAVEPTGGGFQTGYLMRTMVDYLEAVRLVDAQAYAEGFNYLSGLMEWNLNFGHFPYYFNAREGGQGQSDGTGLTLVDPQAWYYWHTGKSAFWDQVDTYVTSGIGEGAPPYGEFGYWGGQWEGRYYLFVKNTARADSSPPPVIADLAVTRNGNNVDLGWTAPADGTRYHIVWSTKPLSATSTTDTGKTNWWAAEVVGPALVPVPGAHQTLSIATGGVTPVYVAVFTFDQAENMSAMSNVAEAGS